VQPGDTVGKIAKELGTTIRAIREENQLKNDLIFPGQKLRVTVPKVAQRQLASI
jgi:LysM repeat protein